MVAVPLGRNIRFLAVVAPGYLVEHKAPTTPDALSQHRCIRQRLPSGKRYRWEFTKQGQVIAVDVPGALTLDNSQLMIDAAINGLGIAYVPEPDAAEALRAGSLVTVLEDWCPPIAGHTLYFSGYRQIPLPLRAFIDTIRELDVNDAPNEY